MTRALLETLGPPPAPDCSSNEGGFDYHHWRLGECLRLVRSGFEEVPRRGLRAIGGEIWSLQGGAFATARTISEDDAAHILASLALTAEVVADVMREVA